MEHVAQQLREQLRADHPRKRMIEALFKLLVSHGTLPDSELRLAAWAAVLGAQPTASVDARAELKARIGAVPLDLPNQRVVTVDAERTRPDMPTFRAPEVQNRICRLLTFYCKEGYRLDPSLRPQPAADAGVNGGAAIPNSGKSSPSSGSPNSKHQSGVHYRQGLNELLAVFLMLEREPFEIDDGVLMLCWSRMVSKYCPRLFANTSDSDFISLQCSLRLLTLMLQYHDPRLCAYLEQFHCVPELYATPWFLTLFARGMNRECCMVMWDFLVSTCRRPGPTILHCVAVAFMMSHRETIMKTFTRGTMAADLPIVMSRLQFQDVSHVRRVCAQALELFAQTPTSFKWLIHAVCYSGGPGSSNKTGADPIPISPALLSRLEKRVCVKISVEEVLIGAGSRFATTAPTHASLQRSKAAAGSSSNGQSNGAVGADPDCSGFNLLNRDENWDATPRYFLIDVRSKEEYEYGGHLPTAFHLDPALLQDPEKLDGVLAGFSGLKGVHFAILGAGDIGQWYHAPVPPTAVMSDAPTPTAAAAGASSSASIAGGAASTEASSTAAATDATTASTFASESIVASLMASLDPMTANEEDDYGKDDASRAFVALFLQRGFTRVGEVEGGYTALHQHQAHFLDEVLVGHDRAYCMVCSGGNAQASYAGRNALERGELIQDAAPYRLFKNSGAGTSTSGAAAGSASRPPSLSSSSSSGQQPPTPNSLRRDASRASSGSLAEAAGVAASSSARGSGGKSGSKGGGGDARGSNSPLSPSGSQGNLSTLAAPAGGSGDSTDAANRASAEASKNGSSSAKGGVGANSASNKAPRPASGRFGSITSALPVPPAFDAQRSPTSTPASAAASSSGSSHGQGAHSRAASASTSSTASSHNVPSTRIAGLASPPAGAGSRSLAPLSGAPSSSAAGPRASGDRPGVAVPAGGHHTAAGQGAGRPSSTSSPASSFSSSFLLLQSSSPSAAGAGKGTAASKPASTSSSSPSQSKDSRRPHNNDGDGRLVIGYDDDGFPILSEAVHLELQCDMIELQSEAARRR